MRLSPLLILLAACGTARPAGGNGDGDSDIDVDADADTDADSDAGAIREAGCDTAGTACYDGPEGTEGRGACVAGTIVCVDGDPVGVTVPVCQGSIGPAPETCNDVDDDCDGVVDGPAASSGVLCNTRLQGGCRLGHIVCEGGAEVCVPEHAPGVETCANPSVDDDCDGVTDDVPEVGQPCDTGQLGLCAEGSQACDGADLVCEPVPGVLAQAEACGTGVDEDCDGQVDEAGCVACGNPGGGALVAENGTGANEMYCYAAEDSNEIRARKACESHFGEGACCVIQGGYQNQQYGDCNLGGEAGSIHWHWDNHPAGHCEPNYVVGDVVSPGWCGVILGNLLD